jgi:hypothetical protein
MGLCYKELNMFAEARAEFDAFLDKGKDELKPKEIKQVEAEIADLGSITATIVFQIDTPGVTVEVDGENVTEEASGFGVEVDPGKHVVRATAEGYEPFKDKVLVSKGGSTKVVIDLAPLADTPEPLPVEPPPPAPAKKKSPAAFWVMAGLTLAIGAGAAVTGGLALSKKNEVVDLDRDTEDAFDSEGYTDEAYDDYRDERGKLLSDGQTLGTLTTVLMAGAGAALLATVIAGVVTKPFAKDEQPASDVSINVAPVVLDSGGLLLLSGSF